MLHVKYLSPDTAPYFLLISICIESFSIRVDAILFSEKYFLLFSFVTEGQNNLLILLLYVAGVGNLNHKKYILYSGMARRVSMNIE